MLAEGRRRAEEAGLSGLRWVQGTAEGLGQLDLGLFLLVTFGQSYHWTAGVPVLDTVHGMLEPGGAVALVGHRVEGRPVPAGPGLPRIPEAEIMQLVDQFADNDDAPRRQKGKRATPHLHAADVRASHFGACHTIYAPGRPDVVRNVDSVLAGYYSTSYAAPRYFGIAPGLLRGRTCGRCCSNDRRRDSSGTGRVTPRSCWRRRDGRRTAPEVLRRRWLPPGRGDRWPARSPCPTGRWPRRRA